MQKPVNSYFCKTEKNEFEVFTLNMFDVDDLQLDPHGTAKKKKIN